jgi:hypothetical protein
VCIRNDAPQLCPTDCTAHASTCPKRRNGGLALVEPKSRAGRRTISLPPQLVEALRAHRAAQAAERLRAGSEWQDDGLVFAQPNGRPTDPRADYAAWKDLLAGARACRREWRWRSSATPKYRSPSARTATSRPSSSAMQPSG